MPAEGDAAMPTELREFLPPGTLLNDNDRDILLQALAMGMPLREMSSRARENRPPFTMVNEEEEVEVEDAAMFRPLGVMQASPPRWWGRLTARIVRGLQGALMAMGLVFLSTFHYMLPTIQDTLRVDMTWARVFYGIMFFMMDACFIRAVLTSPGYVKHFKEWIHAVLDEDWDTSEGLRYCTRCRHTKPPRSHHCSPVSSCVLRMDHYCPWISNCVGKFNHKFFIQFLFFACIESIFTVLLSLSCLSLLLSNEAARTGATTSTVMLVTCVLAIAIATCCFVYSLLSWHITLAAKNLTTIEAMLNRLEDEGEDSPFLFDRAFHRKRMMNNLRAMFGQAYWEWFVPIHTRENKLILSLQKQPVNLSTSVAELFQDVEAGAVDPEALASALEHAGVPGLKDSFVENRITDRTLLSLRFRHLNELGITSFESQRIVLGLICALRNSYYMSLLHPPNIPVS